MLIRIRGGSEGIAEYLRDGKKSGREHTRDELDERLILAGNLDVTDAIIATIEGDGERYKHITLSFKEDNISPETLAAVVEDFRSFAFAAYHQDEYNFYAEAHLPKIKSYTHGNSGEFIERKPHIHIVVPKANLFSGQNVDPFGFFNFSERHLIAFQQHINDKYGLADPQENRRIDFSDASEMISRYKGDTFEGANRDLRSRLFDAVMEREIGSFEAFQSILGEFGAVKVRNAGKASAYANVTLPDSRKGVNLKDYVFTPAFLSLSIEEKRRFLAVENHRRYEAAGDSRKTPDECEALLKEWRELRAREVKYINSGNRKFYAEYKAMSRDQKIALLAEREERFYRKHLGADYERFTQERTDARAAAFERIGNNLRSAGANLAAARGFAGNLEQAARNVADRAAIRALAAVINGREGNQAEGKTPARSDERSRTRHGDSVVGRYSRELDERRAWAKAGKDADFAEIKQHLEAGRLLSYLSKSHGVIVEKYEVTRGKDGSERIKCGNRHLNVSDFLTKEMNLPWKEAAPILREVYAAQRQLVPHHAKQTPKRELWAKFQEWKQSGEPTSMRKAAEGRIKDECKQAIAKAVKACNVERSRIEGDRTLSKAEARRLKDIAIAQREHVKKEARDTRDAALAVERSQWKGDELYKRYLAEAAQSNGQHAEAALAELRKRAPDVAEKEDAAEYIKAADAQSQHVAPIRREFDYRVDTKGNVTYKIDGKDALKDEGRRVSVLQADDAAVIEEGLYLAKAKFGKTITLHGTDAFKAKAVQIAVEKNIPVEFSDPQLQRMKHELQEARAARFRALEQGRNAIAAERQRQEKERAEAALRERAKTAAKEKAKEAAKQPAKDAAKPIMPQPAPLPEATPAHVLAVPGSQPPYKRHGTFKGEVLALDSMYVYQQTAKGVIHHLRTEFKEVPKAGDEIAIRYDAGKVSNVKEIDRGFDRGR